jgi:hypothetical protein
MVIFSVDPWLGSLSVSSRNSVLKWCITSLVTEHTSFRILSGSERSHGKCVLENCWARIADDGYKVKSLKLTACGTYCWWKIVWTSTLCMVLLQGIMCNCVTEWKEGEEKELLPLQNVNWNGPDQNCISWEYFCPLFTVYLDRCKCSLFQSGPLSLYLSLSRLSVSSVALCTSNCNKWHCSWTVGVKLFPSLILIRGVPGDKVVVVVVGSFGVLRVLTDELFWLAEAMLCNE